MRDNEANNVIIYHHRTQATDAQGIHIQEMCRAFTRNGFEIVSVSLVKNEAVGQESRDGTLYRIISVLPGFFYELLELGYNVVGVVRMLSAIRKHKPRFIYERYSIYNVSGVLAAKISRTPIFVEYNAPLAFEKSTYGNLSFQRLAQKVETWIANNATKTLTVTSVLRNILIRNGASQENIVVIPNGVNLSEYGPPQCREDATLITIGFVGWFRDWHGLVELVEALARHKVLGGTVKLLLVGDGPLRPRIEEVVAANGLEPHVRITGSCSRAEVRACLKEIDIAIQPAATAYASPMKLIEYMASGKAIIAPDQANIREYLQHGENALLFRAGDPDSLVSCILSLVKNSKLLYALGQKAHETVVSRKYTWDENVKRVLNLL